MSIPGYGPTGSNLAASGRTGGGAISPRKAGYDVVQTPRLSPQVMQLWEQLMGGSQPGVQSGLSHLSQLAGGGSEDYWKQLEAPALRQFGELQGDIASRFSGLGSGGRHSSGFQNALGGAAADLSERLQSQRLGLQRGAIDQLLGLYGDLMHNDPYEMMLTQRQKKPSIWQKLLGGGLPIAGAGLGALFGGPAGAALGGQLGGAAGAAFQ
jgi:hypothetical protein